MGIVTRFAARAATLWVCLCSASPKKLLQIRLQQNSIRSRLHDALPSDANLPCALAELPPPDNFLNDYAIIESPHRKQNKDPQVFPRLYPSARSMTSMRTWTASVLCARIVSLAQPKRKPN